MPRPDLLSLTADDLATLANRGLVKRAQTELDSGQLEYTLTENKAGTVSVLWSDDVHCLLPSNAPLQSAKCSCPATTLCRHLIRSVLAYQREHPAEIETAKAPITETITGEEELGNADVVVAPEVPASSEAIWNPAEISDEDLAKILSPAVLTKARKTWQSGLVIEAKRGARPTAWFHTLGVNLRFLVPHDARYTHCDCAEAPPCLHLPLAVWAFRELAKEVDKGLISTNLSALPIPTELLDNIENTLSELAQNGVSGVERNFLDQLARLENECRTQGLVWPAEIVAELTQQIEWYLGHNARFEAQQVAGLVGELLIRCDAIRADTGAVPALFVRGASTDKMTEVGAARLIGIGTHARSYAGGVELKAFLQDTDSGAIVVVARDFPNPKEDTSQNMLRGANNSAPAPASLSKLGSSPVIKGVGIASIGSGQVLARGGKRAPSGLFSLGRTPISINPQAFEWEKLRTPLLFESFNDLETHLQQSAPSTLRPRRMGEDVHVVKVAGVQAARFVISEQQVEAILVDENGNQALLIHPYTSRGEEGITALLETLQNHPQNVRFISGRFSRSKSGLKVEPLALVLQEGSTRRMIQPWVSPKTPLSVKPDETEETISPKSNGYTGGNAQSSDPLRDYQKQLIEALGELFLVGLQRADERIAKRWTRLKSYGLSIGFSQIIESISQLSDELTRKSNVRFLDTQDATRYLKETAVTVRLLEELI